MLHIYAFNIDKSLLCLQATGYSGRYLIKKKGFLSDLSTILHPMLIIEYELFSFIWLH